MVLVWVVVVVVVIEVVVVVVIVVVEGVEGGESGCGRRRGAGGTPRHTSNESRTETHEFVCVTDELCRNEQPHICHSVSLCLCLCLSLSAIPDSWTTSLPCVSFHPSSKRFLSPQPVCNRRDPTILLLSVRNNRSILALSTKHDHGAG